MFGLNLIKLCFINFRYNFICFLLTGFPSDLFKRIKPILDSILFWIKFFALLHSFFNRCFLFIAIHLILDFIPVIAMRLILFYLFYLMAFPVYFWPIYFI